MYTCWCAGICMCLCGCGEACKCPENSVSTYKKQNYLYLGWKEMNFYFHFYVTYKIVLYFLFINMHPATNKNRVLVLVWFCFLGDKKPSSQTMAWKQSNIWNRTVFCYNGKCSQNKTVCESLQGSMCQWGIMETVLSWHTERQSQAPYHIRQFSGWILRPIIKAKCCYTFQGNLSQFP